MGLNMRNGTIGLFITRVLLGLIFFMQGFGKVFTWGIDDVYNKFFVPFQSTFLPDFIIRFTVYYTSYVELTGGFLLILGLFRNYALYALGIDLIIVSFGHGIMEPIWDLQHIIYRAVLLIPLLLLPDDWDKLSIDFYLKKKKDKS